MKLTRNDIDLMTKTPQGGYRTWLANELGVDPKITGWLNRIQQIELTAERRDELFLKATLPKLKHYHFKEAAGQLALL